MMAVTIYHGTTTKAWGKRYRGFSWLYVTLSLEEAESFAVEAGAGTPIVVAADLHEVAMVSGLEWLPDEACVRSYELDPDTATWEDTARLCGMFQIGGRLERSVKPLFQIVRRLV